MPRIPDFFSPCPCGSHATSGGVYVHCARCRARVDRETARPLARREPWQPPAWVVPAAKVALLVVAASWIWGVFVAGVARAACAGGRRGASGRRGAGRR